MRFAHRTRALPGPHQGFLLKLHSGNGQQDDDGSHDHDVGIEQDEDACVVQAPFALQATRRLCHAPSGEKQSEELPARGVKLLNRWKPGEPKTRKKRTDREDDGAGKRLLPETEDVEEKNHNSPMYDAGAQEIAKHEDGAAQH